MRDIDVVKLILQQIGELRVPIREEELRAGIKNIARNLSALKEAMEKRDAEAAPETPAPETPAAEEEAAEDV